MFDTWSDMGWMDRTKVVIGCVCLAGIVGFLVIIPFVETPSDRQIKDRMKAVELFDEEIKRLNPLLHDAILYIKSEIVPERHLEAARKLRAAAGL